MMLKRSVESLRRLRHCWTDLRSSLWLVPAAITLAAVIWAFLLIGANPLINPESALGKLFLLGVGAEGARSVLSTIASSMITVAGVAFSITIVALSLASSQYSSRVLRNFMRDRTNQTVLGVLVGIFAYCLVVLRTIQGGDEGPFVPSLAVLGGVVLAFVGIGFFIYFIHHIASAIQASSIIANIAAETLQAVDHLFPQELGDDEPEPADPAADCGVASWRPVPARHTGYLQQLDTEALLAFAQARRTVVRMELMIGEFAIEGAPLVSLAGPCEVDEAAIKRLNEAFTVDRYRTTEQDAAFGIRQLVDVALKGLSPGINDTTTAVMCVDYLTAILMRLTRRRMPTPARRQAGALRVIARGPTFAGFVAQAFDQIRRNAEGNVTVLERLLQSLELLGGRIDSPSRRQALLRQAMLSLDTARRSIPAQTDRQAIETLGERLTRTLSDPPAGPAQHSPAENTAEGR